MFFYIVFLHIISYWRQIISCVLNICIVWGECLTMYDVWHCGCFSYCFCLSDCFILKKYCLICAKYLHAMRRIFNSARCLTLCLFFRHLLFFFHIVSYGKKLFSWVLNICILWKECLTVYDIWYFSYFLFCRCFSYCFLSKKIVSCILKISAFYAKNI